MIATITGFLTGLAAAATEYGSSANCVVNGQSVPCDQMVGGFAAFGGLFLAIWGVMMIVMLAGFVLWVFMLIHAATKPIEHKAVWIVVLALTGWLGAIVYYFAVKKPFDQMNPNLSPSAPPPAPGGYPPPASPSSVQPPPPPPSSA